jgi:hypothetical protein
MPKTKLFCVPFAGGSAANFVSWKKYLYSSIELKPVELSGRGKRLNEPLYKNVTEAVEDIFQRIRLELNDNRYAFFGHSLGAILVAMNQANDNNRLYPLTHPQKRIWYLEKLYPDTSLYNIGGPSRIKGQVNFTLLEEAIQLFI